LPTATLAISAAMSAPSRTLLLAATAALVAAPSPARAQFTVYTSLDAWLAAVSAPGLDTFNNIGNVSIVGPVTRTAGAYSYRANASAGRMYPAGTLADRWLSTDDAGSDLVFDNFSPTVRGVGGYFFATDLGGAVANSLVTLTAVGVGGTTTVTLTNLGATSFWGVVGSGAITSLTVSVAQPATGTDFRFSTANDLRLGAAVTPVNVVPEPSTYALFATGVIGLGAFARRRTRATTA
jgi:hypothetical protein